MPLPPDLTLSLVILFGCVLTFAIGGLTGALAASRSRDSAILGHVDTLAPDRVALEIKGRPVFAMSYAEYTALRLQRNIARLQPDAEARFIALCDAMEARAEAAEARKDARMGARDGTGAQSRASIPTHTPIRTPTSTPKPIPVDPFTPLPKRQQSLVEEDDQRQVAV